KAAVVEKLGPPPSPIERQHIQVPLRPPGGNLARASLSQAAITLSGGVGQLVYDQLRGQPPGGVTQFGDLGGELASRIVCTPAIVDRMRGLLPAGLGRA